MRATSYTIQVLNPSVKAASSHPPPEIVHGKRILELGSGVGLLGMVTAAVQKGGSDGPGKSCVYLTDVRSDVLERCQNNVDLPCSE